MSENTRPWKWTPPASPGASPASCTPRPWAICATLTVKRFRRWWHNFQCPAHVTLRLQGRDVTGGAMLPYITAVIEVANGKPVASSIREVAPRMVVIRVTVS